MPAPEPTRQYLHSPGRAALVLFGVFMLCGHADDTGTRSNPAQLQEPTTAQGWVDLASQKQEQGDLEDSIEDASRALEIDPKNTSALELRAGIYFQEKLWDLAGRDFARLSQLSPDPAYAFKLADIDFLQRNFSAARPKFLALSHDERLGDLSAYKAFLCDLLGGHETWAVKDLAGFKDSDNRPSYDYANMTWALSHNNGREANRWYATAKGKFGETAQKLYYGSVLQMEPFRPEAVSFQTKDGHDYHDVAASLEEIGLRVNGADGWKTIPLDQLSSDLGGFPEDMRDQIVEKLRNASFAPSTASTVSFTTTSGLAYKDVRYHVDDSGLAVLTSTGWKHLPASQLPGDPSVFPKTLRDAMAERQKEIDLEMPQSVDLTFTTLSGQSYLHDRTSLAEDGVRVLSDDGLTFVPFPQLPNDLSPFPKEWQDRIRAGLSSDVEDAPDSATITFTTKLGKTYRDVRVGMDSDGLRVLTENGWIVIPYPQLQDELSPFPAVWRPQITKKQKEPPPKTLTAP